MQFGRSCLQPQKVRLSRLVCQEIMELDHPVALAVCLRWMVCHAGMQLHQWLSRQLKEQRTNYSVLNAMPCWWTAEVWQSQFPADDKFLCNFDLQWIKEKCLPDDSIHYCPDFAGPRKKGRPKKNTCAKSPLEMALSQHNGTGVKKRRVCMTDEELENMGETGDGEGCGDGNGATG